MGRAGASRRDVAMAGLAVIRTDWAADAVDVSPLAATPEDGADTGSVQCLYFNWKRNRYWELRRKLSNLCPNNLCVDHTEGNSADIFVLQHAMELLILPFSYHVCSSPM